MADESTSGTESPSPNQGSESPAQVQQTAKKPIYKKWWVWLIAFFVIVAVLGALDDETAEIETEQPATAEVVAEDVSPEPEPEPAPEPEPEPETELTPEEEAEIQRLAFEAVFEDHRRPIVEVLEEMTDVETVDKLVYDAETETVLLDITSGWASPDNQVDGAWAVTRTLSVLYEPNEGAWWQDGFLPAVRFTNSGKTYNCSGEFMERLADTAASRDDWERECW